MYDMKEVGKVWRVVGDKDKMLFSNKESAEIHARMLFPNESASNRYFRVVYQVVWEYYQVRELS